MAKIENKEVTIEYQIPPDHEARFADHFVVQVGVHEVRLSFYQIVPPPILTSDPDVAAKLDAVKSLPAKCVASVALPLGRMRELVDLLQRFLPHKEKEETEEGAA